MRLPATRTPAQLQAAADAAASALREVMAGCLGAVPRPTVPWVCDLPEVFVPPPDPRYPELDPGPTAEGEDALEPAVQRAREALLVCPLKPCSHSRNTLELL